MLYQRTHSLRRAAQLALALLALLATFVGFAPPVAHASGGIEGAVLREDTGAPLEGLKVIFYLVGYDDILYEVGETESRADGSFSIAMTNGTYVVEVVDQSGQYAREFYDNAYAFNAGRLVVNGAPIRNVNLRLARAGSISGRVTVGGGGDPAGVVAYALAYSQAAQDWLTVGTATVEANGSYSIGGLRAGSYRVAFIDPEGRYSTEYYDDALTPGAGTAVNVAVGAATPNINATLARAGQISGRVTASATGAGIGGVLVTSMRQVTGGWEPGPDTMSEADGSYTITGLVPGVYRVRFSDTSGTYAEEHYNNKPSFEAADNITVNAGATFTANAALAGAASGQIRVTVTNGQGTPLPNITVALFRNNGPSVPIVRNESTNAAGVVSFTQLGAGNYRIGFADPAGTYAPEFYEDKADLTTATVVELPAGADLDLTARLARAGAISGRVTSQADGSGIGGAIVSVFRASDNGYVAAVGADGQGSYAIRGLRPGSYKLSFYAPGYNAEFYDNVPNPEQATPVTVTAGDEADGINAALTSGEDPTPGYSATLSLDRTQGAIGYRVLNNSSALADTIHQFIPNGSESPILSASYPIGANSFINVALADLIDLPAGFKGRVLVLSDQPIAIQPISSGGEEGAISGRVTDGESPLAGAHVHAYREVDGALRAEGQARSGADGRYSIGGLPAGTYRVYFYDPATYRDRFYNVAGKADGSDPVSVAAGASVANIDAGFAPPVPPLVTVELPGAMISSDPDTGLVTVGVPAGSRGDILVRRALSCPGGAAPAEPVVVLGITSYPMYETPAGSGIYLATLPGNFVSAGDMGIRYSCGGSQTTQTVGRVILYDPSGQITDAVSGRPVEGAVVTLYNVPGWRPRTGPNDNAPQTCQSNSSKPAGSPWSQPAPVEQGLVASPDPARISPPTNPQVTGVNGRYGWDVAEGCWYIVVEAAGYKPKVSPVVGVPPAVTDLDLELEPLPAAQVPTVAFGAASYQAQERAGSVTVMVRLSAPAPVGRTVTVRYAVTGGTAAPGDHGPILGSLSFAPGQTTRAITVRLNDNATRQGDRTVQLSLSGPVNARLGAQATTTLRIIDDERAGQQHRLYLPLIVR